MGNGYLSLTILIILRLYISHELGGGVHRYLPHYNVLCAELLQYGPGSPEWDYITATASDAEIGSTKDREPASVFTTWEMNFRQIEATRPNAANFLTLL